MLSATGPTAVKVSAVSDPCLGCPQGRLRSTWAEPHVTDIAALSGTPETPDRSLHIGAFRAPDGLEALEGFALVFKPEE